MPQHEFNIFACHIADDGLETIKNQGRQDIRGRWKGIEDYWVDVIYKQAGDASIQWLNAQEHLSYQMPKRPIELYMSDFVKSVLNYILYVKSIDDKNFKELALNHILYHSDIPSEYKPLIAAPSRDNKVIEQSAWDAFVFGELFDIKKGKRLTKSDMREGTINYIGATAFNNGIRETVGNEDYIHPGGTITVCYNGSVGEAFYQTEPYWATDDVNILYPKFAINKFVALFLTTIIRKEGQKYGYNNKWTKEVMEQTPINLPTSPEVLPDFAFMENFVRDLFAMYNEK